jgi:hypothetical protein
MARCTRASMRGTRTTNPTRKRGSRRCILRSTAQVFSPRLRVLILRCSMVPGRCPGLICSCPFGANTRARRVSPDPAGLPDRQVSRAHHRPRFQRCSCLLSLLQPKETFRSSVWAGSGDPRPARVSFGRVRRPAPSAGRAEYCCCAVCSPPLRGSHKLAQCIALGEPVRHGNPSPEGAKQPRSIRRTVRQIGSS